MTAEKVGIITQYYKSHNYGGLLQAYALTIVIKTMGYDVEQIAYDGSSGNYQKLFGNAVSNTNPSANGAAKFKAIVKDYLDISIRKEMNKRFLKMERFGHNIPHSDVVYNKDTVVELQKKYKHFVVGSDQVWNPQFYAPVYFCDFVKPGESNCVAYAASVSQKQLTEKQAEIYKEQLKKFSAISLRENNIEIIQELTDTKVEWVLDPTLLLTDEQWNRVCSDRLIDTPYVFCYFLGNDHTERWLAEKFAKEKKLKLVTIPHLSGSFDKADFGFGDKKIISAGPEDFLSLIKHAEYVFTDSFHACVFSYIYKKQFFVFQRVGMQGMSTRIETLLSLFGNTDRFCNITQRQTMEYLLSLEAVSYTEHCDKFENKLKESINFLVNSLAKNGQ